LPEDFSALQNITMTAAQLLYNRHIRQIPAAEQLELIVLISRKLLRQHDVGEAKQRTLLELEGLGAEIWEGVDPQQYVDDLRNEWDNRP
jgi:hypothetical protein